MTQKHVKKNGTRLVKTRKNGPENKHIKWKQKWSKNVYNDQNTHQEHNKTY